MQVKELKNDGLSYELEVTVEAKDIDKEINDHLTEYSKKVALPGFRKGKVPLDIMKQRYGRAVMGEVLEKAVNDSSAKALMDKKLKPAMQPKIEVTEFDEGKDLKYKMNVEVLPTFKIMDMKGIKIEKPVAKVEKKAIDEALEQVAKGNKDSKKVDRAAKKGDVMVFDFHGRTKDDNQEHPGMHAHDHSLELGSGQFIGGFEDQLMGKKSGDKVEVNVKFPDDYHAEELKGREAIFDVDVKEIQEYTETKINEDFAKKLGFEDKKGLVAAVEEQIQSQHDQLSRMKLKRALLDVLDDGHDFDVPQGMLDLEYENIMQQVRMERQAELKDGKLELSKDEEQELRAICERRVRLGMVLSEIGQSNNIQVNDQELQRAVIREAQRYPGQEAQIFEYYKKNRQALDALRAPLFEDKVIDFILELADVKEKTVSMEELTAEEDESYTSTKKSAKKPAKTNKKFKKPKKPAQPLGRSLAAPEFLNS